MAADIFLLGFRLVKKRWKVVKLILSSPIQTKS